MAGPYIDVNHHEDFVKVYDLDDPRSYFRALHPLGYRAPTVMADFLNSFAEVIRSARKTTTLRVLDFACGYGPIGALLGHDLTLDDLYARYANDDAPPSDAGYFQQFRQERPGFVISGIDTARQAVAYATTVGFLDAGFSDDLVAGPPGAELAEVLRSVDVVVESGSITSVLPTCFARIIDAADDPPWFIQSPRGDTDPSERLKMFADHGYVVERATVEPVRYRRLMANEADSVLAATRAVGHDPADHFDADWFVVPIDIARPRAVAQELPIAELRWPNQSGTGR